MGTYCGYAGFQTINSMPSCTYGMAWSCSSSQLSGLTTSSFSQLLSSNGYSCSSTSTVRGVLFAVLHTRGPALLRRRELCFPELGRSARG